MSFRSILYRQVPLDVPGEHIEEPEFFKDLNIDHIVTAITAEDEYNLKPFFYRPLRDIAEIVYRQEVMRDLEDPQLFGKIGCFSQQMREMRRRLKQADQLYYQLQKNAWFVEAVAVYCQAVKNLMAHLNNCEINSQGFCEFRDYLSHYLSSQPFITLAAKTEKVRSDLHSVKYCVLIRGSAVTVRRYEDEADYSAEIEQTFAKFRQRNAKDYLVKYSDPVEMNHIEARILDQVVKLHPEIFANFEQYCAAYRDFADETVVRFDREVQFYILYLEKIGDLKRAGLTFCYPVVECERKEVCGRGVFDLALAIKLAAEKREIVPNDFDLRGRERVFVVSGPNQGGKTTFARTFGQMHYLASLGCPVPGSKAQLFLYDRLFTHFEKEEDITNLRGKLQDDLVRVRRIMDHATPNSIVIMNEIFSSTALEDAVFLASRMMQRILDLDCLCVCVSFLDELAGLRDSVVSMVSTVVPDDPAQRTFKLIRRPADGRAYAISIAQKYRLTYQALKQRIAS
jgi:DNA mismatch repair protein MutS